MREGYNLVKSIENIQHELETTTTDEDNQIRNKLIAQYYEQLNACDSSFVEIMGTVRQIQMNISRFDDSCQDIANTIKQHRALFEQFIDNNHSILPDNLNQQVQILRSLQREIETKTSSMIETLRQTTKEIPINGNEIECLTNDSEQLKSAILVSFRL